MIGRKLARLALVAVTAFAAQACASVGEGTSAPRNTGDLTPVDFEGISERDVMGAISLLRPQWLRARNGSATVVVNGQRTNRDRLAQIPIGSVLRVRFMSAPDATTRFGTGFFNGAIVVTLR